VTNTGATVLDGLEIDAPIGRVIRDAVQAHARHVGDGTTTTALLVGELLDAADTLAERGLHTDLDRRRVRPRGLARP